MNQNSQLDKLEKIAKILSLILIPIIIAYFGWRIEESINRQTLSRDYVQIALAQVTSSQVDPDILAWAIDLLNENAPVKLSPEAVARLKTRASILSSLPDKIVFINHIVQNGDTMYSITQRTDTSIPLISLYGISQDFLIPGDTIRIPIGNSKYCLGRGKPYAIGEGDTVFNVAQRFNTTPEVLQSTNGLDVNFTLEVADIICIP